MNMENHININELNNAYIIRLQKYFIEGEKDIYLEIKYRPGLVIYQWGTTDDNSKDTVNNYMLSLIKKNKKYIGRIISGFVAKYGGDIPAKLVMTI